MNVGVRTGVRTGTRREEHAMSGIERIMAPGLLVPVSHYCHAVRSGDHVWISGMVGAREDRDDLPESVTEQFRIALAAVDSALRAAGGTGPENIVKVTVYLTDVNDRAKINPMGGVLRGAPAGLDPRGGLRPGVAGHEGRDRGGRVPRRVASLKQPPFPPPARHGAPAAGGSDRRTDGRIFRSAMPSSRRRRPAV